MARTAANVIGCFITAILIAGCAGNSQDNAELPIVEDEGSTVPPDGDGRDPQPQAQPIGAESQREIEGPEAFPPNPFAPVEMRVHPLTHVGLNRAGKTLIVVHIELRDQWLDVSKGLGQFQVRLSRATGLGGGGNFERVMSWEVDLREPAKNAEYFDIATRTYRLPLEGVPEWAAALVRQPGEDATRRGDQRGQVVVIYEAPGPNGESLRLRDQFILR